MIPSSSMDFRFRVSGIRAALAFSHLTPDARNLFAKVKFFILSSDS
jgi:hypothetical protein